MVPSPSCHFVVVLAVMGTLWSSALCADAATDLQYTTGSPGLLNCDRDARTAADCDAEGYRLLLAVIAAPGAAGAVLVVLCLLLYFLFKYVCDCCGGRHQHPNFCCPNRELPAKYSKSDLVRPRVYAVAVFVLLLGGCGWGCSAATHVAGQLNTFRLTVENRVQALETIAMGASETFQTVVAAEPSAVAVFAADESNWRGQFSTATDTIADELQRMTNETVVPFTQFFSRHLWSVYVVLVLLVVGSVVGVCAALCHVRLCVPMALVVFFGVVGGVGACGLYGALLVGERLFSDVCHEVDAFVSGQVNVLSAVTACNESALASLPRALEGSLAVVAGAACDALQPLCFQLTLTALLNAAQNKTFACESPSLGSRATCTSQQLTTIHTIQQARDIWSDTSALTLARANGAVCQNSSHSFSAASCTLARCAENCVMSVSAATLSYTAQRAQSVLTLARTARDIRREVLGAAQISVLGDCESVLEQVVPPLQVPCATAPHSILVVRQAVGFAALVSVLAMGTYMIGAKRFIPLSQALQPQYG